MTGLSLLGALALAAAPTSSAVPAAPEATPAPAADAAARSSPQGPDLELHVPKAEVEKVSLEVENLQARLDLDTRVAGLVQISAGVVATVQKLKLEFEGIQAETHLLVRLDRVAEVMERALGTIDKHPGIAGAPQPQAAVAVPVAAPVASTRRSPPAQAPAQPGASATVPDKE